MHNNSNPILTFGKVMSLNLLVMAGMFSEIGLREESTLLSATGGIGAIFAILSYGVFTAKWRIETSDTEVVTVTKHKNRKYHY